MRASQLLLPTVKEDPAGAEAASHKLMVRAGLIRQLAAGIYVFLPAGWRVMRKIEAVMREEMEAIGCQEMLYPVINPAEIWQQSGRWQSIGDELFRFKDRKGTDMVLAMTHEEVVTWLAAHEVHSYKQLPQLWFHIQTKERDEARPKSGLLRTREFIMKDSYSLDTDFDALQVSYEKHIGAYDRIFARCGLEVKPRAVRSRHDGRQDRPRVHGTQRGRRRRDRVLPRLRLRRQRRARRGRARRRPRRPPAGSSEGGREVPHPGQRTIDDVAAFLGVAPRELVKSLVVMSADRGPLLVLVRGDHDLHEGKLRRIVGEFRLATADEVLEAQGVAARLRRPRRHPLPVLGDEALRGGTYTGGANKPDHHLAGIAADEVVGEYHDLRVVHAGDPCPECGHAAAWRARHRGRQHLPARHQVLLPMGATYLDEQGKEQRHRHGQLRHRRRAHRRGGGRAAPRRARHLLAGGASRPLPGAPRRRAAGRRRCRRRSPTSSTPSSRGARLEVLFDDRDVSPGVKFKDADLLGCPVQVVVGKRAGERVVELKPRASARVADVAVADLVGAVRRGAFAVPRVPARRRAPVAGGRLGRRRVA